MGKLIKDKNSTTSFWTVPSLTQLSAGINLPANIKLNPPQVPLDLAELSEWDELAKKYTDEINKKMKEQEEAKLKIEEAKATKIAIEHHQRLSD